MIKSIIKYSLIGLFLLIALAIITPEPKTIYTERKCEECSCSIQEIKIADQKQDIAKLKKVIELDNEAFALTGEYIGRLDYWLMHPLEAEHQLEIWLSKINKIANEKSEIINSIN